MTNRQKRFNQFLSFLRDPGRRPSPLFNLNTPVRLNLPNKNVMRVIAKVKDVRQTAIEIMESGIFRHGRLTGNRTTIDKTINNVEEMILELAGVIELAKKDIGFCETRPWQLNFEYLCGELVASFDKAAEIIREKGLIRKDRLANARKPLIKLKTDALRKAYLKMIDDFDLVSYTIRIFFNHVGKAPDNLIANHIYNLLEMVRSTSGLNNLYIPDKNAMRQRVKDFRRSTNTPKI